jgi:hypothetical protein
MNDLFIHNSNELALFGLFEKYQNIFLAFKQNLTSLEVLETDVKQSCYRCKDFTIVKLNLRLQGPTVSIRCHNVAHNTCKLVMFLLNSEKSGILNKPYCHKILLVSRPL